MVDGIGKVSISDLLASHTYHKIYMMLGINELGYDVTQTFEKYASFVNFLQTMQPDAIIYVEANLHVTAQCSDSDIIWTSMNFLTMQTAISAHSTAMIMRIPSENTTQYGVTG